MILLLVHLTPDHITKVDVYVMFIEELMQFPLQSKLTNENDINIIICHSEQHSESSQTPKMELF